MDEPRRMFARAAFACLVALPLVKEFRSFLSFTVATVPAALWIAPSLLGSLGLLFLIQAVPRFARFTVVHVALFVAVTMFAWEFAQALPALRGTRAFHWRDVAAVVLGLGIGVPVSRHWRRQAGSA
jgi:hypothetical protein